jgi:hypothetical protein
LASAEDEYDDCDDDGWEAPQTDSAFDETAVFLASVLNNDDTIETTAMMMEEEFILLDEAPGTVHNPIIPTSASPRVPPGEFHLEAPRHVGTVVVSVPSHLESLSMPNTPPCPAQAAQAVPGDGTRSCDSRQSSLHDSAHKSDLEGGKVEDGVESNPAKYLLLTDGRQFRLPFWTKEAASLQRLMDKQRMRHPQAQIPDVPSPEDLQLQFIHWLLERPEIPMWAAPANAGFYDDRYYASFTPEPSTGFFDEEYVAGKRLSFIQPNRQLEALNPSLRASPTY